ncbi:L-arabinose isomerase [Marinimicrobium sp. ABcell2]|uniref:L-arabinose isomerase n=1 Tax=Marinimicrobium sp. ABcell2 TaxID=3069751 RepID=UPI0027B3071D|nr:L-arabinose isomerase [Marinimicrobium sp. ABcell2]MDQ2075805.1 L-arabinose isomerase [Marinimicrobium sp. ABcell2]
MKIYGQKEVWLVTGSQHLYGPGVLKQVAENSQKIAASLTDSDNLSCTIVAQDTVKTPEEILAVCLRANSDENCAGLILWMHTFSPAKMWIAGLKALNKPYMHLHTQFKAELPWSEIDMNYMNLNQSAHGDREFGYIGTRMGQQRRVVVGHWETDRVQTEIDDWVRVAMGWQESQNLKVARFADNMRQVAVTEGDKVTAQLQFGYEVHAFGLGDLAEAVNSISDDDIDSLTDEYTKLYTVSEALLKDSHQMEMLRNEARLELGIQKFLDDGGFKAFTNCFENLTGLTGLPGLATQRLMAKGYGYGAEGDWKTAAMTRIVKVMSLGREGGTSFMEDYTYNFGARDQVLGAHMLEVCPSIAAEEKPRLEVHKHTIGIKKDIARLIFTGKPGPALNISTIDLGTRFRILVNEVDTVTPPEPLPHLPVGTALWEPRPSLAVAGAAWIHAGGAHHSVYTQAISIEQVIDFCEMAGVEATIIDEDTKVRSFKNELRQNSAYYFLKQGV